MPGLGTLLSNVLPFTKGEGLTAPNILQFASTALSNFLGNRGMFAVLGDIEFEVLTSPTEFRARIPYTYAQHDVVEDKPKLQWIANALEEITLRVRWHAAFTNPYDQYINLRSRADEHLGLPLVFGNGNFRGYYVIEEIEEELQHCADDGSLIIVECTIRLKEFIPQSTVAVQEIPPGLQPSDQAGTSILARAPFLIGLALNFKSISPQVAARVATRQLGL